jgi:hypothetical protein
MMRIIRIDSCGPACAKNRELFLMNAKKNRRREGLQAVQRISVAQQRAAEEKG